MMEQTPGIAVPVALVAPVSALVAQHEGVDGVALLQNGRGRTHLRVEYGVAHVLVAGQHPAVLLHNLQPHLSQHTSYFGMRPFTQAELEPAKLKIGDLALLQILMGAMPDTWARYL